MDRKRGKESGKDNGSESRRTVGEIPRLRPVGVEAGKAAYRNGRKERARGAMELHHRPKTSKGFYGN